MQGAVDIKPDFIKGGVVDLSAVSGENQRIVSVYIFVDLHAGGIPNVLVPAQECAQFIQKLPVVIVVEFEAMTGEHKQSWIAAGAVQLIRIQVQEILNVFFDLGIVVA